MASAMTLPVNTTSLTDYAPIFPSKSHMTHHRGLVGSPDVYDLEFTRTMQEVCANGWVARMGYSCRATTRTDAIRNAIIATIHSLLAHPSAIWDENEHVSSRNSYIELNRAAPAFSYDEKMGICHYIYIKLNEYLRIKHAFDLIEKGSAFAIALNVSRANRKWDTETCGACGRVRDLARYPIVIFIPCEHVACMRKDCALTTNIYDYGANTTIRDQSGVLICPYCNPRAQDSETGCRAPMPLRICSRMHIIVDYDLEIPTVLIDDFAKKIAYANII